MDWDDDEWSVQCKKDKNQDFISSRFQDQQKLRKNKVQVLKISTQDCCPISSVTLFYFCQI